MGPHAPQTKQAWKELNEHFGRCPKCGTDPFVGWGALSSHTAHVKTLFVLVNDLARADIAKFGSRISDVAEGGRALNEIRHSETGALQGLSEYLTKAHTEAANVKIRKEKFECKECGVIWNPEKWNTSLTELRFTAVKY